MKTDTILERVNGVLAGINYPAEPKGLYEPVDYVLGLGGKRLRPVLMLLVYSLYKPDYELIMPAAVAIEMYHNYTLLHDDLMDHADLRRGKPTVHKVWDNNTAILSGDVMLVLACRGLLSLQNPKTNEAMELFLRTATEVAEGQQMDMNFEKRDDVTEAEYIAMIRLKTAVLVAAAARMGALLGGAAERDCDKLQSFGERVGLAFQLQDDLLDAYGNTSVFGKRTGGDILQNKRTWLFINAYAKAGVPERNELDRWFSSSESSGSSSESSGSSSAPSVSSSVSSLSSPAALGLLSGCKGSLQAPAEEHAASLEEEKIAAVMRVYDKLGVKESCQRAIDSYFQEARNLLDEVNISDEAKGELWAFASSLCGRVV